MADDNQVKPGARAKPNKELKSKIYHAIFIGHYMVAKEFKKIPPVTDVTAWSTITSYCATMHKISLQKQTNTGGIISRLLEEDKMWELGGVQIPAKDVYAIWEQVMQELGFGMEDNKAEWVGTMSSLLTLMTAFSRRLNETRVPPTKFDAKVKKSSKEKAETPISQFGLDKSSAPYLEGLTYAPHMKSSMINSLGPLTITIGLALSFDPTYGKKWRQAFKNCWGMLDFVDELIEEIEGNSTQSSQVISKLATLCLFGVPRAGNKAYIPFVALAAAMMEDNAAVVTWIVDPSLTSAKTINVSDAVKNIDSSGHGMWHAYNLSLTNKLTMRGNQGTGKELGQLYMHAFLGTHKDDLSLLEWMTGKEDFLTRSEIGSTLQGPAGEKMNVEITRYPVSKICKLSSSSGTSLMSGGEGQIQRMSVLSGKCTQDISQESKILNCLKEATTSMAYRSKITVSDKLTAVVDKLARKIAKAGKLEWGSTSFFTYDAKTKGAEYGAPIEENFKLTNKYFFANA